MGNKISRRGDGYLRTLLILGARSSLQRAQAVTREKATPEQLWIRSLAARLPFGKLVVAIANKHARQLWAMLARGEDYDPDAWSGQQKSAVSQQTDPRTRAPVVTHAQLDFLCVHGVDECQGRLFGMAVPEALAKNFLGARVPPREDPSLEQVRARP